PLRSERCVVKVAATEEEKKIRRWRKIALEAGRQSGRSVLPEVAASLESVGAFCRRQEGCDLKLIFWEEETTQRLQDVRPAAEPRSIACLIGPEGGFTRAEVETARERGFQSLSLGPRILKAETAPVAMLALLQHLWGDM
ncbi:MAG: RsmE family RNA methyltransferase, partial [Nitrospinaceae bacterium]|nr:RNA methyltransferase [Nitrospinaceae bacterium]NIR56868.1 RNA methyltransferase [Nitrospinaceae bacterium]NIS87334.1 RNA methyltransferase [Nitrospinaceae bacterium]NIT84188.1 RNA methyltransferase [Nitrospinaceae bacterium]NIU46374.1 RNA methyltransferase [Nitrospinaceae bacterium]